MKKKRSYAEVIAEGLELWREYKIYRDRESWNFKERLQIGLAMIEDIEKNLIGEEYTNPTLEAIREQLHRLYQVLEQGRIEEG